MARVIVALFVLTALVAADDLNPNPLPWVDVTGWTQPNVQKMLRKMPSQSEGGWWMQVGNRIFSPSLGSEKSNDEETHADNDVHSYRVVVCQGGVPEALKQFVVAEAPEHNLFVVHVGAEKDMFDSVTQPHVSSPIVSGMKFFVDSRQPREVETLDLEHDFEGEELQASLDEITEASYMDQLNRVVGTGSGPQHQRNVATSGHTIAEKYLACELQKHNMHVELVSFNTGKGNALTNVVGCRPGTESSKFLLAGAHFDTLPGPPSESPGAMDNGSGVAVVLSVLHGLKGMTFKNTVCLAFFDGEELGLMGSGEIATRIQKDDTLKDNFMGAITSDMSTGFKSEFKSTTPAGWDKTNTKVLRGKELSPSVDGIHIDGDANSRYLISILSSAAQRVTDAAIPVMTSEAGIWNSDHKSFMRRGLPALDICAANHREYKFWHNLHNTTERVDGAIGAAISRTSLAAIFTMAELDKGRSLEAVSESTLPQFGGQSMKEAFGAGFECSQIDASFATAATAATASGSESGSETTHQEAVSSSVQDNSEHESHLHMRLELMRQMEAVLDEALSLTHAARKKSK